MGAWKTKLIFLLVVYFAGFATAIYCLAPVPETRPSEGLVENQSSQVGEKSFVNSALKSNEFAQSFNAGMHKCLDFGKTAAQRVGTFLKQKLDDRHQADG